MGLATSMTGACDETKGSSCPCAARSARSASRSKPMRCPQSDRTKSTRTPAKPWPSRSTVRSTWRLSCNANRPHSAHSELTPAELARQRTTTHQPKPQSDLSTKRVIFTSIVRSSAMGAKLALGAIRRRGSITVIFVAVGSGRGTLLQSQPFALFPTAPNGQAK